MYLFLAVVVLFCFSLNCSRWGLLSIVVHRLLIAVASLVVEHRLCGALASVVADLCL